MQFVCRVGTPDGRVLEEPFAASDESALMTELGKLGYHVFDVRRRGLSRQLGKAAGRRRRKPIKPQEFMVWNRELAALLKARPPPPPPPGPPPDPSSHPPLPNPPSAHP